MKSLLTSKQSNWQTERADRLQRLCAQIKTAIASGLPVQKTIRQLARRWHGRSFKSNPAMRWHLSPATLRRAWDLWCKHGEVASAFRLKYRARAPYVSRRLLIRFMDFCATQPQPSVKVAWQRFAARPLNAPWAKAISYGQVCYHFPAAAFYQLQGQLKASLTAQAASEKIRAGVLLTLTNRLAARPPRHQSGPSYQI